MKKWINKETMMYLVFGVLTTMINFVTYYVLTRWLFLESNFSNILSIMVAIVFAFVTNQKYVFTESKTNGLKGYIALFVSFVGFRLVAMVVDVALFYVLTEGIGIADLLVKIIVAVVIIVFNYLMSKWFIFNT